MPSKKKAPLKLKVVFDTNVLYTQVVYDLLRPEIKHLILANSQHVDLDVQWYIPEIVIKERRYQMEQKALELLPGIQKLETLLGHNLNITPEILWGCVEKAILNQIDKFGLSVISLQTEDVDWTRLIDDAAARRPPFESGEKEKGFRDAIVANTFLQLVRMSPVTPSVCRLVLLTGDQLLADCVKDGTKDCANVRILADSGELEGLINTLVSAVKEEFVQEIAEKAKNYFFEKGNESSLYYKEGIREEISGRYGAALNATPSEELRRENGTWYIIAPVFLRKERQRVFWITPIKVEAKLYKHVYGEQASGVTQGIEIGPRTTGIDFSKVAQGIEIGPRTTGIDFSKSTHGPGISLLMPRRVDTGEGVTIFQVHWSVNVTQTKRLTSPRIEKIEFVGSNWEEF